MWQASVCTRDVPTCPQHSHTFHFARKFTAKMPPTKTKPKLRCRHCASLRSSKCTWTSHKRKIGAILCGVSTSIKHQPWPLPQEPLSLDTLFKDSFKMQAPRNPYPKLPVSTAHEKGLSIQAISRFIHNLPRALFHNSCQESFYTELVQRSQKEILPRDLYTL